MEVKPKHALLAWVAALVLLFFVPFLVATRSWLPPIADEPNLVGDAFGGIAGPIVGMASALLTYFAFYVQYKANQNQQDQINIQRLENTFNTLLNIHFSNLTRIPKKRNESSPFVTIRIEYAAIYTCLINYCDDNDIKFGKKTITNICFNFLYYGTHPVAKDLLINTLSANHGEVLRPTLEKIYDYFRYVKETYNNYNQELDGLYENDLNLQFKKYKQNILKIRVNNYKILNGYHNSLSNYFRSLHNIISFINESNCSGSDKKKFIDLIKGQMTQHEIVIFTLNIISSHGKLWTVKGRDQLCLVERYSLIKNLQVNYLQGFKSFDEIRGCLNINIIFEQEEIKENFIDHSS